jgi:hypothetical protein
MEWWSHDMAANIGVATGSVNRLAVIDLDVKRGQDGPGAFRDFLAGPPQCPDTGLIMSAPSVRTPSGGLHYWLRTAEGEAVPGRDGILPGVDVKGDGGLIVSAPSMIPVIPHDRSGGTTGEVPVPYAQESGCPHAVPGAPGWLVPWLASAPPPPRTDAAGHAPPGAPLDDVLPGYLENGIPPGQRNRETYRIACGLYRRHGTSMAGSVQVMDVLLQVHAATDKNGFGWREVLVCAESARRFVERQVQAEDGRKAQFRAWLERGDTR